MEMGVRRAEAAGRTKSAGGETLGVGSRGGRPTPPLQDGAQAIGLSICLPPSLIVILSSFLHFRHLKAACSGQSSGTETHLTGILVFPVQEGSSGDGPTSFYKAGHGGPETLVECLTELMTEVGTDHR